MSKVAVIENRNIFMYWEGKPKPYYRLCMETVLRHNPDAAVVGPNDVEYLLGPLPQPLRDAYVVHRVDWIRKKLVATFGGMYVDADFICFKPLSPLVQLADAFEYVGYREWPGNHMDNVFVGAAGSRILETAAEYALERITRDGKDLKWLSTNADAIGYAVKAHEWSALWLLLPTHLISPVTVLESDWFVAPKDADEDLSRFASFGFITSYHSLRQWAEGKSRKRLLNGDERVCHLLRRGLA